MVININAIILIGTIDITISKYVRIKANNATAAAITIIIYNPISILVSSFSIYSLESLLLIFR